jgi:hypothetical protein
MLKDKLNAAFRDLRKAGYFARQNFACCQSCGCAEVPDDKAETYVFYHRQDAEHLEKDRGTYLAYAGNGRFICETFGKQGLAVEWDGSTNTRIWVGMPE